MNLPDKYRPKSFDEVVGQEIIVKSLKGILSDRASSSFLFSGASGVGKTTIARICSSELNCTEIRELDAASNSGVDNMKEIIRMQDYYAINGGSRVFIIDECHRLSKNAWDVLLKATEEPPENNYWFFCTTEINKLPRTIRTRCAEFNFKPVKPSLIKDLIIRVRDLESLTVTDDIVEFISESVMGSPRQALNLLQQSNRLSLIEFKELVEIGAESSGGYELAKMIVRKDFKIEDAMKICKENKNENPEVIRQTVRAYFTSICLNSPNNRWASLVLSAFERPSIEQNKISDIVLRLFKVDSWRNK